jgi:DNA-directed RNA polymerase subunit H (RpoH/RPB5)
LENIRLFKLMNINNWDLPKIYAFIYKFIGLKNKHKTNILWAI